MPDQSWTVIDTDENIFDAEFAVHGALSAGIPDGWSVKHRVLRGGKSDGVSVVEVNNGRMTVALLPTRGMSLWKAWHGEHELGWKSPVHGPVHPQFVPLMDPNGLGWLEGFDELMVRCGLESNGAPDFDEQGRMTYPLHGRVGNLPAKEVTVSVDEAAGAVTVRGVVEESRFHFQKLRLVAEFTTKFDSAEFEVHDSVENFGGTPATMQMLYHINFGEPLLDAGSQLVAPVAKLVPRNDHAADDVSGYDTYSAPTRGYEEQVYFFETLADSQGDTRVLFKNSAGGQGVSIGWNTKQVPYFVQWKNTVASADGYVTGLEPGTNFPNPRTFEAEHGRVVELAPGASWQGGFKLHWLTSAAEVNQAESAVKKLQGSTKPEVLKKPQEDWCAP